MTDAQATTVVSDLYHQWAAALTNHDANWFERHIASDFSLTAHPFAQIRFDKRKFIEVDMQIENTKITFLDIRAHAAGDILVSQAIAEVKEDFKADLGHGMPSAAEVTKLLSGQVLAYSSAWRENGSDWQCFDHHMIGPVKVSSSAESRSKSLVSTA
jgi:ketosteroid isomerase-like protein